MASQEATKATCSSSREIRCSTIFAAILASKRWCKRLPAGNNASRIGRWALSVWTLSVSRVPCLRLFVNGLALELLPLRVGSVDGHRARFPIRRNRDPAIPADLSIPHRGDVVSPIVYHSVGDGVIRQIPFHRVGFPIELADPNAVRRFPILVYALHGYLNFVLLLRVSDRGVFSHPRHELRLRLIELPCAHVRVRRKTGCCCRKRQGYSHNCNSSFYHAAIPAEMPLGVNTNHLNRGLHGFNGFQTNGIKSESQERRKNNSHEVHNGHNGFRQGKTL